MNDALKTLRGATKNTARRCAHTSRSPTLIGDMDRRGVATVKRGRRVQSRKHRMVRYVEALPRIEVILDVAAGGSEKEEAEAERDVVGRTGGGAADTEAPPRARVAAPKRDCDVEIIERE